MIPTDHNSLDAAANMSLDFTPLVINPAWRMSVLRAHGILMVLAYCFFATVATTLARHFRDLDTKVLNTPFWFFFHRCCMIFVWMMTIAGTVMIFVEVGDWITSKHTIVGVIVTGLVFIHPFLAFLRPPPDSGIHFTIFVWAHTIGGYGIHIGAFACLVAIQSQPVFFTVTEAYSWCLTVFIGAHIVTNIGLRRINADKFNSTASVVVLIIYFIVVILFNVALCTFIGLWEHPLMPN